MTDFSSRQWAAAWAWALFLTALSLAVHLAIPELLNRKEEYFEKAVELHLTANAFKIRPFTTGLITLIHDNLMLSYRLSFFLVQFFLAFLSGPCFFYFLNRLGLRFKPALTGMIIYYLSLPVFLAHLAPVFTWSDFWVYALVPFSFAAILDRRYLLAMLSISLALIERETTFIFVPVWVFLLYRQTGCRIAKPIIFSLAVVALFLITRYPLSESVTQAPQWKLPYNFENFERGKDAIYSIAVSQGFLWVTGLLQALKFRRGPLAHQKLFSWGAILVCSGYLISSLLMAQVRETRLLFPPAIFLIPLTLMFYEEHKEIAGRYWTRMTRIGKIGLPVGLLTFCLVITQLLFPDFDFRDWKDGNRAYFGLHLAITIVAVALYREGKKVKLSDQL